MNEKKLTKLYNAEIENSAPDFDLLWEKIESRLEPKTESIKITPKKNILKPMIAAAAFIVIIPVAIAAINSGEEIATEEMPINTTKAEYTDNAAAADDACDAEAEQTTTFYEAADSPPEIVKDLSYSDLEFGSYSETYLSCTEAPYGDSYFVEDDILGEADYIVKGEVSRVYLSENGAGICYELKVNGSYPENIVGTITIESRSTYTMKRGREYLIPIKETTSGYRTVFDHVPQIEFTADGGMVYYNGWSFSDGQSLIYPQKGDEDFYDRMMYSYSGNYMELIEKFMKLKAL